MIVEQKIEVLVKGVGCSCDGSSSPSGCPLESQRLPSTITNVSLSAHNRKGKMVLVGIQQVSEEKEKICYSC